MVHDRHQQHPHRTAEVDRPQHGGIAQDRLRPAQIALDDGRAALALQQRAGVHQHHRIVVDVDHPGAGIDPLRDLVHVARPRQAGAEVEELGDAAPGQMAHRPAEKRPVGPRRRG